MKRKNRSVNIIAQVAALFLVGILTTGILSYFSETHLSYNSVSRQTELHASEIAGETKRAVMEYPACQWLIHYWCNHPDMMDIEYDVEYSALSRTAEKCRVFSARHPEVQLRYASTAELNALPEEDQKLYAEIAYSWLITRVDQIKQTYHVDYLFCVVTEAPFTRQF